MKTVKHLFILSTLLLIVSSCKSPRRFNYENQCAKELGISRSTTPSSEEIEKIKLCADAKEEDELGWWAFVY